MSSSPQSVYNFVGFFFLFSKRRRAFLIGIIASQSRRAGRRKRKNFIERFISRKSTKQQQTTSSWRLSTTSFFSVRSSARNRRSSVSYLGCPSAALRARERGGASRVKNSSGRRIQSSGRPRRIRVPFPASYLFLRQIVINFLHGISIEKSKFSRLVSLERVLVGDELWNCVTACRKDHAASQVRGKCSPSQC